MRSLYNHLSLKSQMILIIVITGSIAAFIASLIFAVADSVQFTQNAHKDLEALADIIGNNSRAALMFQDKKAAEETISALQAKPHIVSASILNTEDAVFATYTSARHNAAPGLLTHLMERSRIFGDWHMVTRPIMLDNMHIGSVLIASDPQVLASRIEWYASVIGVVLAGLLVLMYLLSAKLQAIVSTPIMHLSMIMKQVTDEKNYSVRAQRKGSSEVRVLIDCFNEMLSQIQSRDYDLEASRKYLEHEVARRTTALEEWRTTFDSTQDAIFMLDEGGVILRANKAATMCFAKSFGDIVKHSMNEIFETHGLGPEIRPLSRSKQTNSHEEEEVRRIDADSWFIVSVDPIITQGKNSGAVLILKDITEWKKAQQLQQELREQLIEVQKMESIGMLAGGIAHDFNNILSAIIGFSHVALTKLPNDHPAREPIRITYESGERAATLTRQLLAVSRKQVLDMKVLNLNEIIERMSKILNRVIGENLAFDVTLQPSLRNIVADAGQMEQILMNMVVNARDAMKSGGRITLVTSEIRVTEASAEKMPAGWYVLLSLIDTGMGMTKDVQDRIFEPFFTTKDRGKGTGLGLATVYGIVKQHNGHIVVQSELGQGTTFHLYFPIVDREVEKNVDFVLSPQLRGTETVLVVDDEPTIRKLLIQTLEPLGYRVIEAASGADALKLSEQHQEKIHLLISDVIMPGMNGVQLAEALQQGRPELKVLFISGYTDDAFLSEDMIKGEKMLLQKPIIPSVLEKKVREILDTKEQESSRDEPEQDFSGIRVLYADDDPSLRILVQRYLEPLSCKLDLCENGKDAVAAFQKEPYDVILMDLQMPVMDGLKATRAIRMEEAAQGLPGVPIIALTGASTQDEIRVFREAGCTRCLPKPIHRAGLLAAVRECAGMSPAFPETGERIVARVDRELQDLVPGYLENRRTDVAALKSALQSKDYDAARILGHSMKGSGGGYGFDGITALGMRINHAAKKQDIDALSRLTEALSRYLERVDVTYS